MQDGFRVDARLEIPFDAGPGGNDLLRTLARPMAELDALANKAVPVPRSARPDVGIADEIEPIGIAVDPRRGDAGQHVRRLDDRMEQGRPVPPRATRLP